MTYISAERARELISYCPETGKFTWNVRVAKRCPAGSKAGNDNPNYYSYIRIDGTLYLAHRIAWLIVHGDLPKNIDHINGDKGDNRLCNLRVATKSQNGANRTYKKEGLTSKWKGVCWNKGKQKWESKINKLGKRTYLGWFDDEREAAEEYMFAALDMYGDFARFE